jgi:hypothetical protein
MLPLRKTYNSLTRTLRIIVMPTEIHDTAQDWWHRTAIRLDRSGDCTEYEELQLNPRVGTSKSSHAFFNRVLAQFVL